MVEADESDDDGHIDLERQPWGPHGKHDRATYTVLLVEDDCITCKIVADGLRSCRYNGDFPYFQSFGGQEGFNFFLLTSTFFNLVRAQVNIWQSHGQTMDLLP